MSMPFAPPPAAPPPAHPARRRGPIAGVLAHLAWEGVLLLLLVVMTVVIATRAEGFLSSAGMWYALSSLGLLATGFALSVRTATPNLAVAAVAGLAGAVYAKLLNEDVAALVAGSAAVSAALVLGLLLGLITGLTAAPAWAVSLGGAAGAFALAGAVVDGQSVSIDGDATTTGGGWAAVWTVVFVAISVGGGLVWLVPGVRRVLGANRTATDPAVWSRARLTGALVGLGGSSMLAGVGGVVTVGYLGGAMPGGDQGRMFLALGAVLLGGVSVFGRRGGVTGTVLAVALLTVTGYGLTHDGVSPWIVSGVLVAAAIIVGVVVSRALESIAGPEEVAAPPWPGQPVPATGPAGAPPPWQPAGTG